jgi:hypothetical protein
MGFLSTELLPDRGIEHLYACGGSFFGALLRGSAVFDGDTVGKIEGIVDVEGGQG